MSQNIIGFPHPPSALGGPGSFQIRLEAQLKSKGWKIVYPNDGIIPSVILVVGGTRKINWLKKCKKKNTKIVHRLDGFNWQYKFMPSNFSIKLKAIIRNWLFKTIRKNIATEVIYQSHFIQECWEKFDGSVKATEHIIYNAVKINDYSLGEKIKPDIVCVEGTIQPHPASLEPLKRVAGHLKQNDLIEKVVICGVIDDSLRSEFEKIDYFDVKGCVDRQEIPKILKGNIFMVLEVNPPCPNSVIEALASGCPVIGFNSGSLKDIVGNDTGFIAEYGNDPWKMEVPVADNLIKGLDKVVKNYNKYSIAARKRAEHKFDIKEMTRNYIKILSS